MVFRSVILSVIASAVALAAAAQPVRVTSETADAALTRQITDELPSASAPETVFEARRQAKRAAERIEDYLNSQGYFAAEISHAVEAGPPITPMIKVEPGPKFDLAGVELEIESTTLTEFERGQLHTALTLKTGDPAIPQRILAQEAGLLTVLRSFGFGEAKALPRTLIGDREAGTLGIVFRFEAGPRLRFGDVIYPDGTRTRRDYLDRLIPFEEGDVFSPKSLAEYNRRLNASRSYTLSSAQLTGASDETVTEGEQVRDVIVTLNERQRYTFTAGASFSTSEGAGLTSGLTRRNATRRGDTLTGRLTLAQQTRGLAVDWRIPNVLAYNRSLAISGEATREETDAFDRDALTLLSVLEVKQSEHLTYALGAGSEFTREIDADSQANQTGERDLQIVSVSAAARLDYADSPLDPTRGWRADVRAEPAIAVGDRASQFFTLDGQVSAYTPLMDRKLIAAARLRSAFVYGAQIDDLPVSRRFFAGGGGSARGFEYQSVGPKNVDGNPTGGRGLLETSGELRWRGTRNLGYVAFVDAATVSTSEAPRFDDLRYSAGIGVRYKTVAGPIRFDIATPLDRQSGEDPIQIYVSLGQAF